jgi:hypothetical protein
MNKNQTDVSHIDKGEISEPIAWTNKKNLKYLQVAGGANIWNQSIEKNDIPLYTHPIRELSDEEIMNEWYTECCPNGDLIKFARAILKKASEK